MSDKSLSPKRAANPPVAGATASRRWRWLVWAAALFILAVLGWGLRTSRATTLSAGDPAPAFEMSFFDGYRWQDQPVAELADFRGQVVVLNFWASWCAECRLEAELLEDTWRAYRDQDVVFLGLAYVDIDRKSLEYLAGYDITYPNAPDRRGVASKTYRLTGVPETYFIDADGNLAHVVIGPVTETELLGTIERLLAERVSAAPRE